MWAYISLSNAFVVLAQLHKPVPRSSSVEKQEGLMCVSNHIYWIVVEGAIACSDGARIKSNRRGDDSIITERSDFVWQAQLCSTCSEVELLPARM